MDQSFPDAVYNHLRYINNVLSKDIFNKELRYIKQYKYFPEVFYCLDQQSSC